MSVRQHHNGVAPRWRRPPPKPLVISLWILPLTVISIAIAIDTPCCVRCVSRGPLRLIASPSSQVR